MMINFIGFQICWFGLVIFGNDFSPIALLLLIIHFYFFAKKKDEIWLVLSTILIGSTADLLFVKYHLLIFQSSMLIPIWLITLWACFASTIYHSLSFLTKSRLLQLLTGAFIAPLSYLAGNQLNAVEFTYSPFITYLVLGIAWSILLPLFFKLETMFIRSNNHAI